MLHCFVYATTQTTFPVTLSMINSFHLTPTKILALLKITGQFRENNRLDEMLRFLINLFLEQDKCQGISPND